MSIKSICKDFDDSIKKPCLFFLKGGFCRRKDHYRCIEFIRRKYPVLSHSSDSLWRKCRRAFYFYYILGYKGKEIKWAMLAGVIYHLHMAWVHGGCKASLLEGQRLIHELKDSAKNDILLIPAIVEVYTELYGDMKGVAEQSKTLWKDEYAVKSIVDLLLYDKLNRDYIHMYDWKYCRDDKYYTFFTTEYQAGLYLMMYPTVKDITYRCIVKPLLRCGKNETWDEFEKRVKKDLRGRRKKYFVDKKFYRSEYNFPKIRGELIASAKEISDNIDKGIDFFRENREACYFCPTGEWCDYKECCEAGLTPDRLPELFDKINVEDKIDKGK